MAIVSVGASTIVALLLYGSFALAKSNPWQSKDIFSAQYNALQAPLGPNGESVNVSVRLQVNRFLRISESDETFQINCHLKQRWIDKRFTYPENETSDSLVLRSSWSDELWRPSTYFFNAVEGSNLHLLSSPIYYEISRDGTVTMSSRMIVKLTCNMDLTYYPHDRQQCYIHLESLSDLVNEVSYQWEGFTVQRQSFHGFSISHLCQLDTCYELDFDDQVGHSCAKAGFTLHRQLRHFLIRVYGPSLLIVITTFIGFWIPAQGYPGRVLIILTPLLSLVTQQTQINAELNVSCVVVLHIWMVACTFFVFMALLELAMAVIYVHRCEDRKNKANNINNMELASNASTASLDTIKDPDRRKSSAMLLKHEASHWITAFLIRLYGHVDWTKAPLDRNKIDYCARVIFPFSFFMFVFVYVLVLLNHGLSD